MMQSSALPRILYIAGYGRSGSTILDVLLGAHDRAVSVGELVFLGDDWQRDRVCACGRPYPKCPFWSNVLDSADEARKLAAIERAVEPLWILPRVLTGTLPAQHRHEYRRRMRSLFAHVAEQGNADVVVDSSKSARRAAGRFWALRKIAGLDVRVVHLTRDGRDVLRSFDEKGSNWALEGYQKERMLPAERALAGWILSNGITGLLGSALKDQRYLRVRFEDLLDDPAEVLHRIGAFSDLDMTPIVEGVAREKSFVVGHNVGGNRIRHEQSIQLQRKAVSDRRPWTNLSAYYRSLFAVFGQWLNSKLGYTW